MGEGYPLLLTATFVSVQGKANSVRYIAQVVNPVLLPLIGKEYVLFQQDNTRPHTATATQRALHGVKLPWPARSLDLSPIERVWNMMKRELNLSPEPVTTIAEFRQRVQDTWDNLSQVDIWHLYDCLRARTHICIAAIGGTHCIDVTVWAPLSVICIFYLV